MLTSGARCFLTTDLTCHFRFSVTMEPFLMCLEWCSNDPYPKSYRCLVPPFLEFGSLLPFYCSSLSLRIHKYSYKSNSLSETCWDLSSGGPIFISALRVASLYIGAPGYYISDAHFSHIRYNFQVYFEMCESKRLRLIFILISPLGIIITLQFHDPRRRPRSTCNFSIRFF